MPLYRSVLATLETAVDVELRQSMKTAVWYFHEKNMGVPMYGYISGTSFRKVTTYNAGIQQPDNLHAS